MKLHAISDSDPDDYYSLGWAIAVWAPTEAEAMDYARMNYAGDARIEEVRRRVIPIGRGVIYRAAGGL